MDNKTIKRVGLGLGFFVSVYISFMVVKYMAIPLIKLFNAYMPSGLAWLGIMCVITMIGTGMFFFVLEVVFRD